MTTALPLAIVFLIVGAQLPESEKWRAGLSLAAIACVLILWSKI